MATIGPKELETFINLVFSPFVAMGSLTTFIVGLNTFVAWLLTRERSSASQESSMSAAASYGIARAFVLALPPAVALLIGTIHAYEPRFL